MRQKKSIIIAIRLNKERLDKLYSSGIDNISEAIRRCIDNANLLEITKFKKGQTLQAIETFKFENTNKNVLIVGKEYVIKDVTKFDDELCIIIESEVSKKHNFDVDMIDKYFTFK